MLPSKNLARHYNQLNDKVTSQKQGTFSVDCLFPVKESNHNEEIGYKYIYICHTEE